MATSGGGRGVIYQCGACRTLVAIAHISVDNDKQRAGLTCDVCGGTTWLPFAGAQGRAAGGVVVDVDPAPRANAPQLAAASSTALAPLAPSVPSVPATGGAGASFSSTGALNAEQRQRIASKIAQLPAPNDAQRDLAEAFEKLLGGGQWTVDGEHKQLMKRASMSGELAFIGQRYRQVLDVVPQDTQAKKAQNEILTLAMVSLNAQRDFGAADGGDAKKKANVALAVIVMALVVGGLIWLLPGLLRDLRGEDTIGGDPGAGAGAPPAPATGNGEVFYNTGQR